MLSGLVHYTLVVLKLHLYDIQPISLSESGEADIVVIILIYKPEV
jgi:hypothetical protein